jgi:hypothetical protein
LIVYNYWHFYPTSYYRVYGKKTPSAFFFDTIFNLHPAAESPIYTAKFTFNPQKKGRQIMAMASHLLLLKNTYIHIGLGLGEAGLDLDALILVLFHGV